MSFFLWISRKIDCMFLGISEIASCWKRLGFLGIPSIDIFQYQVHTYLDSISAMSAVAVCSPQWHNVLLPTLMTPVTVNCRFVLPAAASSCSDSVTRDRCSWCTWCCFRLYSDKMWVPASCDSSPCFRLPLSVHTARSRWPHPSLRHTRHHGLLRNCQGTL